MKLTGINNATYVLEKTPLASGGEGDVYLITNIIGTVAKVYKPEVLSQELADKLRYMVDHPPSETVLTQVAWPKDVAHNEAGEFCGFIMPKLEINASLSDVYKYPPSSGFSITMRNKITIAQNICVVINEIHSAGYIFGDFNPLNTGLNTSSGRVSFLDTDTYHVSTDSGVTYRCKVCAPGYCAPELLGKVSSYIASNPLASQHAYASTPLPTFTKETDNFALAIHIFKLLMNGYTPFGGIIDTAVASQASPGVGDSAVRRDSYCFKPGYKHQSVAIPALDSLPDEIAKLFDLAFVRGRAFPERRPSADMWYSALERYEQVLTDCRINPIHQYDKKNTDCPFCAADTAYQQAIGTPTQAPPVAQAPVRQVTSAGSLQSSGKQQSTISQNQPQSVGHTSQNQPLLKTAPVSQAASTPSSGSRPSLARNLLKPTPENVDRMHTKIGRMHILLGLLTLLISVLVFRDSGRSASGFEIMIGLGIIILFASPLYLLTLGRYWIAKRQDEGFLKRLVLMEKIAFLLPTLQFLSIYMIDWYSLAFNRSRSYFYTEYVFHGFTVLIFSVCVLIVVSAVIGGSLVYAMKRNLEYEELVSTTKICGTCGKEVSADAVFCIKCGTRY